MCFPPRSCRPAGRSPSYRSGLPRSRLSVCSSSQAAHPVPGVEFWRVRAPVPCRRGGSTPPAFPSILPTVLETALLSGRWAPECFPSPVCASSLRTPPPLFQPVYRMCSTEIAAGSAGLRVSRVGSATGCPLARPIASLPRSFRPCRSVGIPRMVPLCGPPAGCFTRSTRSLPAEAQACSMTRARALSEPTAPAICRCCEPGRQRCRPRFARRVVRRSPWVGARSLRRVCPLRAD